MRETLTVIVVAAALAAGCGTSAAPTSSTPLPASNSAGAQSGAAGAGTATTAVHGAQSRPFKGRLDGTVTVTPLEPPMANVFIAAAGTATHLGRFEVEIPHLVNFATAIGEGTFTFTAANGDQLTATFTGTADTSTPIFSIVEHATITGGTGRFEDASGSFTVHRSYDVAAGTTTGFIEGTIVY